MTPLSDGLQGGKAGRLGETRPENMLPAAHLPCEEDCSQHRVTRPSAPPSPTQVDFTGDSIFQMKSDEKTQDLCNALKTNTYMKKVPPCLPSRYLQDKWARCVHDPRPPARLIAPSPCDALHSDHAEELCAGRQRGQVSRGHVLDQQYG